MGVAVMAHPTDEEREAMAARLDKGERRMDRKPADNNAAEARLREDAAAMLRACKGRDTAAFAERGWIPVPDHAEWNAAIDAAAKVAQSYGCCHVPQEIAEEIRALKKGQTND